jgi:hypothetical protein
MKTTFENKKTQTERKKLVEEFESEKLRKNITDGNMVGLVGHRSGLIAHVERYRSFGFEDSQVIICEIDKNTWKGLKSEAKKIDFKGLILNNDIVEVATNKSLNIKYVDFDDHQLFKEIHLNFIMEMSDRECSIVVVNCSRGQVIGLKETIESIEGILRGPADIYVKTYRGVGRSPMRSIIINCKGL